MKETVLTQENFIQKLNNNEDGLLKAIQDQYGEIPKNKAFEVWAVNLIEQLEDLDDAFNYCEVGGKDDKGVDAFIKELNEDRIVRIYQVKWSDQISQEPRSSVTELTGTLKWLEDTERCRRTTNKALANCAKQYAEAINSNYDVLLKLIVLGTLSPEAEEQICIESDCLPKNHILEIYDIDRLNKLYEESLSIKELTPLEEEVTIVINPSECFMKETPGPRSLVTSVKTSVLGELFECYKYKLFHRNVRYFKGDNTDAALNMKDTLTNEEQQNNFWYYNNGISMVCKKFYYPFEDNESKVRVINPQIINGCQTTVVLNHLSEHLEDSDLLLRIIESDDNLTVGNISEFTNTQNKVTSKDLRSNDTIQESLKKHFAAINIDGKDRPYYYITKQGEWNMFKEEADSASLNRFKWKDRPNTSRRERHTSNDFLAQAYFAFIGHPDKARTEKSKLFLKQGGYYNEIFKGGKSAEEYLLPTLLFMRTKDYISKFRFKYNQYKENDFRNLNNSEKDQLNNKRPLLYALTYIIGLMGYILKKKYGTLPNMEISKKLLKKYFESDKMFNELIKYCEKTIIRHTESKDLNIYDISNAYKLPETFEELKIKLELVFSDAESFGVSDPLAFLP